MLTMIGARDQRLQYKGQGRRRTDSNWVGPELCETTPTKLTENRSRSTSKADVLPSCGKDPALRNDPPPPHPVLVHAYCARRKRSPARRVSIRSPRSTRASDQLFEGKAVSKLPAYRGASSPCGMLRSDAHLLTLRNVYSICQCLGLN
jgi:hypothetical protein